MSVAHKVVLFCLKQSEHGSFLKVQQTQISVKSLMQEGKNETQRATTEVQLLLRPAIKGSFQWQGSEQICFLPSNHLFFKKKHHLGLTRHSKATPVLKKILL